MTIGSADSGNISLNDNRVEKQMQLTIEIATEPAAKAIVCAIAAISITQVTNNISDNKSASIAVIAIVIVSIITQIALARNKPTGRNNNSNNNNSGNRNHHNRGPGRGFGINRGFIARAPPQPDNVVPINN